MPEATLEIRDSRISEADYTRLLRALLRSSPVTRRQSPLQVMLIVAAATLFLWWRVGDRVPLMVWPIIVVPGLLVGLWKSNWLRPDSVEARLRAEYRRDYAADLPVTVHFAPDAIRIQTAQRELQYGYPQFEALLQTSEWLVLIHTLGQRYYLATSNIVPPASAKLIVERLAQNGVKVHPLDI